MKHTFYSLLLFAAMAAFPGAGYGQVEGTAPQQGVFGYERGGTAYMVVPPKTGWVFYTVRIPGKPSTVYLSAVVPDDGTKWAEVLRQRIYEEEGSFMPYSYFQAYRATNKAVCEATNTDVYNHFEKLKDNYKLCSIDFW
ncbi:MAG TPA: hypothetical protein VMH27_19150 [Puia sp.]|nr:hypothetical protein [Puia sp.]